ncbi:MAG: sulfotransferase domain-containing protein [Opitutaceae bacterium]
MLHQVRLALNGRIPSIAKSAYLKLREINASQRALPDFLIIGAQKAGTTSLFNYLCQHPQVVGSVPKEIFYLCSHPERGERWYRRHFPIRNKLQANNMICGEATPIMLCVEQAPQQAHALIPKARIIAILREPAARAVSHYHHQVRFGHENRPIDEVFSSKNIERWRAGECPDLPQRCYFSWSDYATGLELWLAHYPQNQLLVLEAEAMYADTQAIFNQSCDFLGIPRHDLSNAAAFNAGQPRPAKPQTFESLKGAFHSQNEIVRKLGYAMSWA